MKRRLFNLAAGMSLVLCLATAGLWGLSYHWVGVWSVEWLTGTQGNQLKSRHADLRMVWGYWMLCVGEKDTYRGDPTLGWNVSDDWHMWFWSFSPSLLINNSQAPGMSWQGMVFFEPNSYGFGYGSRLYRSANDSMTPMGVHAAWTVALFAVLPLINGIIIYRRKTRKKEGCCVVCGYDLRATPERCPECGHLVATEGDRA